MTLTVHFGGLERSPRSNTSVEGQTIELGPVDAIPLGEGRAYSIGSRTVAVFRPRDGHLFALDNRCPHRGGPLADGIVGAGTVICPLHGWKFELSSGRCLNDAASVRRCPVLMTNGRMVLLLADER